MEQQHYFNLDEANQKIPWLNSQLQYLSSVQANIERLREDLDNILRKGHSNGHSSTDQDIARNREETDSARNELRNLLQEIHGSGIIVRDTERGLVDFPALRGGREVYLCWLLGEEHIQFWHEVSDGFAGRQPL